MIAIPLRYSIISGRNGWSWQCLECESTGSDPDPAIAHDRAAIHIRSAHTAQEAHVNPRIRPHRWWHIFTHTRTATPRRAAQ